MTEIRTDRQNNWFDNIVLCISLHSDARQKLGYTRETKKMPTDFLQLFLVDRLLGSKWDINCAKQRVFILTWNNDRASERRRRPDSLRSAGHRGRQGHKHRETETDEEEQRKSVGHRSGDGGRGSWSGRAIAVGIGNWLEADGPSTQRRSIAEPINCYWKRLHITLRN